jgi:hypothetical protein
LLPLLPFVSLFLWRVFPFLPLEQAGRIKTYKDYLANCCGFVHDSFLLARCHVL